MKNKILRAAAAAIGAVLMILYAACPVWSMTVREQHAGGDEVRLEDGAVLEVPLETPAQRTERVILRLNDVSAAEKMTLTLTLTQNGEAAAAQEFPLAGKFSQTALQLQLESPASGRLTLRVTAAGEGYVTLVSDGTQLYIRQMGSSEKRNLSMLYLGATMVLLALTPFGRREDRHA